MNTQMQASPNAFL